MSLLRVSGLAIAAMVLCVASDAQSGPPKAPGVQVPNMATRVTALEHRVLELERQVQSLRPLSVTARPDGSLDLMANGVRLQISAQGDVSLPPEPCQPAYTVGRDGIRRLKPGCLKSLYETEDDHSPPAQLPLKTQL